jgi:hypothetical protein
VALEGNSKIYEKTHDNLLRVSRFRGSIRVTGPPQKIRDLSSKIILGNSRWSKNTQTHTYKDTIPYMKFKLKLL